MKSIACAIAPPPPWRERRDVIIVASVSCIYSMGDPSEYEGQVISRGPGMTMDRDAPAA